MRDANMEEYIITPAGSSFKESSYYQKGNFSLSEGGVFIEHKEAKSSDEKKERLTTFLFQRTFRTYARDAAPCQNIWHMFAVHLGVVS